MHLARDSPHDFLPTASPGIHHVCSKVLCRDSPEKVYHKSHHGLELISSSAGLAAGLSTHGESGDSPCLFKKPSAETRLRSLMRVSVSRTGINCISAGLAAGLSTHGESGDSHGCSKVLCRDWPENPFRQFSVPSIFFCPWWFNRPRKNQSWNDIL